MSFIQSAFNFIFPKSRVTGRRPFFVASIIFVTYLTLFSPRRGHAASGAAIGGSTLVSDQIVSDEVTKKVRLLAERKTRGGGGQYDISTDFDEE
ncbi:hypothetical protein FDP41_012086 [Naegleria fowleri]|uniref:Uncharacterized protein n=1 Tax=Naegleria fowleri TaxID=5763 RepID=A0A6A5C835_NAEFO|nr:uncharacterized protein FDP41_012086 [Naegleria fowleri]KAF0981429.1 hypothetical protein FDP41_012086 [Naegleria fowleri]